MEIKAVKPKIWNFEVVKGEDAWKEVVYSARMSGVPSWIDGKNVLGMIIKNDYSSALEHIIIKFDIKMTKGNAPELLEHRMASHSGFSTRYVQANNKEALHLKYVKQDNSYDIIIPWHLLIKNERNTEFTESALEDEKIKFRKIFIKEVKGSLEAYKSLINAGLPRESARYILPFCQAVGIYHFTINLRSLLNLLSLRLCVRTSPEFRCLAAQLYFNLAEKLPLIREMVGCRGFMRGTCPESDVTGVRTGKPHSSYPVCLFKNPNSDIFIPTTKELRKGISVGKFNREKAVRAQEKVFEKWAKWEGE